MPRPADSALAAVAREFLLEMQACVQAVDFERARPLFADDVVVLGTAADGSLIVRLPDGTVQATSTGELIL